jgi:hypothetical protein
MNEVNSRNENQEENIACRKTSSETVKVYTDDELPHVCLNLSIRIAHMQAEDRCKPTNVYPHLKFSLMRVAR